EMAQIATGDFERGGHGFVGLTNQLIEFPKPLLCAVNGLGLGFGATILGLADLSFMSTTARLKCPFTSLGVAPELASSVTFPMLMGRQNATWALLSSEWISADEALEMGLVYKVCEPDDLLDTTMAHARILAAKPISSLVACKRVMMEPVHELLVRARRNEDAAFAELLGAPANIEAMTAFAEKRDPDFTGL
ncbi:MAG: enoyl-CoA hydratase-related protein, partial [Acidimicrobiia bacterium]|nr:enoyl-CoA hydratase-related protein [Acidimicrobiia bacterium]